MEEYFWQPEKKPTHTQKKTGKQKGKETIAQQRQLPICQQLKQDVIKSAATPRWALLGHVWAPGWSGARGPRPYPLDARSLADRACTAEESWRCERFRITWGWRAEDAIGENNIDGLMKKASSVRFWIHCGN
ncbi:hypothetical protein GWI33_018041 [Rhynchophorus ferrugineus]|uniref:Uncharacterized protein n=1 Tax=Rhynchophorus ferrugineus TaxID=354439 RepID=A0A834M1X0_RHYFE|nr:hypothetical protein GWI33_018041 [Rhynchophorus ferrugineus]